MNCHYDLAVSLVVKHAHHQLKLARHKIFDISMPRRLRIITYLRICCAAIQTYRSAGYPIVPEFDPYVPYLTLLNGLFDCHPQWWDHCTISPSGQLRSPQPMIDSLLIPLRNFALFQKVLDTSPASLNTSHQSDSSTLAAQPEFQENAP